MPGVQVKLVRDGDRWLVRALAPAAMCGRGGDVSGRDVSVRVAELLTDHHCPARTRPRRTA